jgi:hypothetical protein
MSEKETTDPSTLVMGEYSAIEQKNYKNGAMHVYGVDPETGKKKHLSHEEILQAYGHSSKERKVYDAEFAKGSLDGENEAYEDDLDAQAELDQEWLELQRTFNDARESGSIDEVQRALDMYKSFVGQFEGMDEADKNNMLSELMHPKQEDGTNEPAEPIVPIVADANSATSGETKESEQESKDELAHGTKVAYLSESGKIIIGKIDGTEKDENGETLYTIEAGNDGRYGSVHKNEIELADDIPLPAARTQGDTPEKATDTTSGGATEPGLPLPEPAAPAEGDSNETGSEQQANLSDIAKVKAGLILAYLAQKREETIKYWQEAPKNRRRLFLGLGAAMVVGALAYTLKDYIDFSGGGAGGGGAETVADPTITTNTPSTAEVTPTDVSTTDTNTGGSSGPDANVNDGTSNVNLTGSQEKFASTNANTPWQAAVDAYGSEDAAEALKEAVKKAQSAGVDIDTFGEGREWKIRANGSWNTQDVAKVLAEYMPKR